MKLKFIAAMLFVTTLATCGQGTFVYDQQSTNVVEGAAFLGNSGQPMGQGFTPALSSIGFVTLNLYDGDPLNNSGATVYVNLRSDSITGPILRSSDSIAMPDHFFGITNFPFSTPVPVTPGVSYYLQPVLQSGDSFGSYVTDGSYTGGSAYYQGTSVSGRNFWFREGILVPEPSSVLLGLIGIGAFYVCRGGQSRN